METLSEGEEIHPGASSNQLNGSPGESQNKGFGRKLSVQPTAQTRRRRSMVVGMQAATESIKERQVRIYVIHVL